MGVEGSAMTGFSSSPAFLPYPGPGFSSVRVGPLVGMRSTGCFPHTDGCDLAEADQAPVVYPLLLGIVNPGLLWRLPKWQTGEREGGGWVLWDTTVRHSHLCEWECARAHPGLCVPAPHDASPFPRPGGGSKWPRRSTWRKEEPGVGLAGLCLAPVGPFPPLSHCSLCAGPGLPMLGSRQWPA